MNPISSKDLESEKLVDLRCVRNLELVENDHVYMPIKNDMPDSSIEQVKASIRSALKAQAEYCFSKAVGEVLKEPPVFCGSDRMLYDKASGKTRRETGDLDTVLASKSRDTVFVLERKGSVAEQGVEALIDQLASTKRALEASLGFDEELRNEFLRVPEGTTPAIVQAVFAQAIAPAAEERLIHAGYGVLTPDMRYMYRVPGSSCKVVLGSLVNRAFRVY